MAILHKIRTALCCLALLTTTAFFAEAGNGINLSVLTRHGYAEVPIRQPAPNVLIVHAKINGHAVRLILDTGDLYDGIILDSDFSRVLHLPGEETTEKMRGVKGELSGLRKANADLVELENVQIRNVPLRFVTLSIFRLQANEGLALTASAHRFEQADGFIGAGFLQRASAIVDLLNLRIYVRPPSVGHVADLSGALKTFHMAEAPLLSTSTGGCVVEVSVDDATSHLLIDTGASLTDVDPRYAEHFKEVNSRAFATMSDVAGTEREANRVTPRSFRVGGNPARPPVIIVSENNFYTDTHGVLAGFLGLDFLGQNKSILDFGRRKLYFVPLQ